jgi:hypothetical protein
MTEWREVVGLEGRYDISNDGRVRSWYRGAKHLEEPRPLSQKIDKYGYPAVTMRVHGVNKYSTVHRLVAIAFIKNPLNLPQVNHKDGNKLNNSVDNLEWCTSGDNMRHAHRNGLISHRKMSEGQRRRSARPEEKARKREQMRRMWQDENFRKKVMDANVGKVVLKYVSPTLGRKIVNDGTSEKFIKKEQVNEYLENGFVLGRLPRKRGRK